MEAYEVRRALPHRFPMLMVDRVLELVPGERIVAVKAITCNEPCYQRLGEDAGPQEFAYPPSLLVESWGQAAGLLALHGSEEALAGDQVMLAGAMSGVTFHRAALPGDVLEHRVQLFRALSDTVIFDGHTTIDGEPAVTFTRMVMAFRPGDLLRPSAGATSVS
ncbi:3-hydroxyacyl-[acyl-carrier-protein] dehydratase FabZ [Streptomyces lucensis JCM 4490]|uniref:3-hydroxyacyl-[acyl-carrier-protein] dehydratase FabZ n=1 Tax=Streptomyces lucensis JCM 4490 TaxID=1306176 RepID=A0A918JJQ8_9ACTN|nr:3-hydroxyacyl-ACP dehydratase FabZ family protein [Streptomyces lucensis]GGW82028.1 3-hydroxyacyl-[acyl-carrier-protein] dehydratase FabZ [Streptomyces lucensis JCM 4490]